MGAQRYPSRGSLLVLLSVAAACLASCSPAASAPGPGYGTTSFDLVSLDERAVKDLFVKEIVQPLEDWRFVPGTKRYFLITDFEDVTDTVWTYVKTYEISDLDWRMTPGESVLTPFVGTVTFTSRLSFSSSGEEPDLPPHRHTHRYVFKNGHWHLQFQRYRIETVSADCLVGHLDKAAWRVEAVCVDEAERLLLVPE